MIDAELIAKVLDGRATPDERARVLAEADRSPELLALLSDSAAAMNAEPEAQVVPIRRPRIRPGVLMAIAAVLIAVVTLPRVLVHENDGPAIAFDVPTSATAIVAARVGATIPTVRGGADENRAAVSAVIGARVVDYIALGTDTARIMAAAEIAHALRTIPGGGIVASRFDDAPAATREMIDAIEGVVDAHAFRAAGAAELLRLAAVAGDEKVLRGGNLRQSFDRLTLDPRLSDDARATAQRIQSRLARGTDPKELADLASQLLATLARRP